MSSAYIDSYLNQASAAMAQELLMNLLGGRNVPIPRPYDSPPEGHDWQTKVAEEDTESKAEPEVWEAYDY